MGRCPPIGRKSTNGAGMSSQRINSRTPALTRQRLADPRSDLSLKELLSNSRSVDLRDNWVIQDLGNGYARVVPRDRSRRWG